MKDEIRRLNTVGASALAQSFRDFRRRAAAVTEEHDRRDRIARFRLETSRRRGTVDDISAHQDIDGTLTTAKTAPKKVRR